MHSHGPSCLSGPISRLRSWWTNAATADCPIEPAQSVSWRKRTMENKTPAPGPEPEIRSDLVERIRREIAAGVYETPEKWALALERLLERLDDADA